MEDHNQLPPYREDGAGAQLNDGERADGGPDRDEDREREGAVGNHRDPPAGYIKWTWFAFGFVAIAGIGGLIAYYLCRRRLSDASSALQAHNVNSLIQTVRDMDQELANINSIAKNTKKHQKRKLQEIVKSLRQNLRNVEQTLLNILLWIWLRDKSGHGHSNRIQGLEQEFGLPKK